MTLVAEDRCDDVAQSSPFGRPGPWRVRRAETAVVRKPCYADVARTAKFKREAEFNSLVKQWKRETAILGHLSKIVMHPAYQRIMAMGPDVIPLILQELSKEPGHWFWALHNLVKEGQDPAEGTTTIKDATRAWLEWGKKEYPEYPL